MYHFCDQLRDAQRDRSLNMLSDEETGCGNLLETEWSSYMVKVNSFVGGVVFVVLFF